MSSPSLVSTIPSAGTWSPRRSTTASSSRISSRRTSVSAPSRSTCAASWCSSAIRSSFRLAEYSWITPITTLATAARQNTRSNQRPSTMIATAQAPIARLNRVSTCTRRIFQIEREVSLG